MDRLFLDANVLFSAAYREDAGVAVLWSLKLVHSVTAPEAFLQAVELPDKDWPILGGAIAAEATHLIAGDRKHFGRHFGKRVHGILVLPPSEYIRTSARTA